MNGKRPELVPTLPERFFSEARRVFLRDSETFSFDPNDILRIAQDAAMRTEFKELFEREVNNPQFGELIVGYLEDMATDLEDKARISEIKVELIDRAGVAISASATAAGIAAIVASGGALGPLVLLVGGHWTWRYGHEQNRHQT